MTSLYAFLCVLSMTQLYCGIAYGQETCTVDEAIAKLKDLKPYVKVAPPAPPVDDGISRANCRIGYYVGLCTSNMEGFARYDGLRILGSRGCIAINSNLKLTNLTATALCIPETHIAQDIKALEKNSQEENVDYTCPEGYVMESCYGLNHWSHLGEAEVIFGPNRCRWRTISGKMTTMKLTYLCMSTTASTTD